MTPLFIICAAILYAFLMIVICRVLGNNTEASSSEPATLTVVLDGKEEA